MVIADRKYMVNMVIDSKKPMCLMPKSGRALRPKKTAVFCGPRTAKFTFFEDLKNAVPGPQNRPLFQDHHFCGPGTAIFTFLKMSFLWSLDLKIGIFWFFSFLWSLDLNFNFFIFVKKYYFCNSLAYFLYYIYK
jgi:hypothetical protein